MNLKIRWSDRAKYCTVQKVQLLVGIFIVVGLGSGDFLSVEGNTQCNHQGHQGELQEAGRL